MGEQRSAIAALRAGYEEHCASHNRDLLTQAAYLKRQVSQFRLREGGGADQMPNPASETLVAPV